MSSESDEALDRRAARRIAYIDAFARLIAACHPLARSVAWCAVVVCSMRVGTWIR
jgi:hypothetical protein